MACLVGASRSAFVQPPAISFLLAWGYGASAIFIWQEATLRARVNKSYYALGVLLTLTTLALPCIVGPSTAGGLTMACVLALICLRGIVQALPAVTRMSLAQGLVLLVGPPLFALFLFCWTNSKEYANVLAPELALLGLQNLDTMYHTAISSMLTQHGAVSTGLDGLVHTPYHALSHLWIGRLSEWFGSTPIHGYYLVVQIVGLPMLLFGLVASITLQDETGDARPAHFPEIVLLPLCLLLLVAVLDWNSYLVSESYLLGMLLFLLGFPLLSMQASETLWHGAERRLLVIGLVGLLVTLAKVSVGAIWFAGVGFLAARHLLQQRLPRKRSLWLLGGGLVVAAALILILLAVLPSEHLKNVRIFPFQFALDYPIAAGINSAAIAAGGLIICGNLVRRRGDIASELLGVLMAASWILAMTINVPAGSDYYFLNVGTWIAIVLVTRRVLERIDFSGNKRNLFFLIGIAFAALLANRDVLRSYPRMHNRIAQLALLTGVETPPSVFASKAMADKLQTSIGAQEIGAITANMPFGDRGALIFIPPGNRAYWEMDGNCSRKALLVPALTGIPLLNGLPPRYLGCANSPDFGEFYGYSEYAPSSDSVDMSDPELCAKATRLGYWRIGVLSTPTEFRLLKCTAIGGP
jgi:hypothetical protein